MDRPQSTLELEAPEPGHCLRPIALAKWQLRSPQGPAQSTVVPAWLLAAFSLLATRAILKETEPGAPRFTKVCREIDLNLEHGARRGPNKHSRIGGAE